MGWSGLVTLLPLLLSPVTKTEINVLFRLFLQATRSLWLLVQLRSKSLNVMGSSAGRLCRATCTFGTPGIPRAMSRLQLRVAGTLLTGANHCVATSDICDMMGSKRGSLLPLTQLPHPKGLNLCQNPTYDPLHTQPSSTLQSSPYSTSSNLQPCPQASSHWYRHTALTGSEDGTLRLWDTSNVVQRTVIKPTLAKPGRVAVTAVGFSCDGGLIAAGLMDGTLQLWDARGLPHHIIGRSCGSVVGQLALAACQMIAWSGLLFNMRCSMGCIKASSYSWL